MPRLPGRLASAAGSWRRQANACTCTPASRMMRMKTSSSVALLTPQSTKSSSCLHREQSGTREQQYETMNSQEARGGRLWPMLRFFPVHSSQHSVLRLLLRQLWLWLST